LAEGNTFLEILAHRKTPNLLVSPLVKLTVQIKGDVGYNNNINNFIINNPKIEINQRMNPGMSLRQEPGQPLTQVAPQGYGTMKKNEIQSQFS